MSLALQFTLTQAGLAAVFNARKTGLELALTHIQLGSGQATPQGLETALIAPQQTAPIASGSQVTPTQIRMSATFSGDAAYPIGEIGVWAGEPGAEDSVLVAYWSRPAAPVAHKSAGVDFIFTHDMAIADALGADGGLTIHIDPTHAGTAALIAAHEAAADPLPQYLREDEAQAIAQQAVQQALHPLAAQHASHTTHPDPHPQYVTHDEGAALVQQHRLSVGAGLTETTVGGARSVALPRIEGLQFWAGGLHLDEHGRVSAVHQVRTGKNDGNYRLRFAGENDYAMSADDVGAVMTAWGAENRTITLPPTPSPGDVVRLTNGSQYPKTLQAAPGTKLWVGGGEHVQTITLPGASHLEAFWDSVCWICRIAPMVSQSADAPPKGLRCMAAVTVCNVSMYGSQLNATAHLPASVFAGQVPRFVLLQATANAGAINGGSLAGLELYWGGQLVGCGPALNTGADNDGGSTSRRSLASTFVAPYQQSVPIRVSVSAGHGRINCTIQVVGYEL